MKYIKTFESMAVDKNIEDIVSNLKSEHWDSVTFSNNTINVSHDWDIDVDADELGDFDRPIHASISISINKETWTFKGEAFHKESHWEWNSELNGPVDFEFTTETISDFINDTLAELANDQEILSDFIDFETETEEEE